MKSNYPDKYCKNCDEVTERYSKGHCKQCVTIRTKRINKTRSEKASVMAKAIKDANRPKFNASSYKVATIESIIQDSNRNKNFFIYFLVSEGKLVYVGKSKYGILGRINEHIKDKTFDCVHYVAMMSEELMDEYELKYIVKYKPKYNKMSFYKTVKIDILDLKTLKVHNWSKEDIVKHTGCSFSAADGLVSGHNKKLYNRYTLNSNKQQGHVFKEILDTETDKIETHSLITFAEKVGVRQNNVWSFFNGVTKSYQKKRYVLVKSKAFNFIQMD